jgi:exodeoxyribonuclease-3
MQEIKCQNHDFPLEYFEDLGYSCHIFGQKSYNGVAILARCSVEDVKCGLPTFPNDRSARYIEAVVDGKIRVASVYVPNGGLVVNADEYMYKLEFIRRLEAHIRALNRQDEAVLIGGDYNITPDDFDVYNAKVWHERVCCSTEERNAFGQVLGAGYTDLLRQSFDSKTSYPKNRPFTWWDYRSAAFVNNYGLRIDHFLGNQRAENLVSDIYVDLYPRRMRRPSDHAPLVCELRDVDADVQ